MMIGICQTHARYGGSAPATLGFNAVAPEWPFHYGAADAAPAIPAPESTLGSHPCVALSSAQVLPEWINRNLVVHRNSANGDNSLTSCLTPRVHFKRRPLAPHPHPRSNLSYPIWRIGTKYRSGQILAYEKMACREAKAAEVVSAWVPLKPCLYYFDAGPGVVASRRASFVADSIFDSSSPTAFIAIIVSAILISIGPFSEVL